MAGRMGGQQHTVQNLKVLQVEPKLGIVIVNGTLCHGNAVRRGGMAG